ncbi:MAG: dTMP kinase [Fimbriimonadaceae bacterium]|nr:dTMP kinase [Fimbriimonadaceae bacterium]
MFVTFEGPEGAGKSTVLRAVAAELRTSGLVVLETREPGAGVFGSRVREWLLHSESMSARAELMLFLADRAEHISRIVQPALERGEIVLCDRHADSTVVYQGYARGLNLDFLREANHFATDGLAPTLTVLLDLPAAIGLARAKGGDRLDAEPIEFHERVRAGFLTESRREPERWRVIDATQSAEKVIREVLALIRERM